MMSDQYPQTFTTTDGTNVTYIQFVDPSQGQLVYCKEELEDEAEEDYYDDNDEIIEESYIEEDHQEGEIEVLEEVVVDRKKTKSEGHHVTKKLLVQIKGGQTFFLS